MEVKTILKRNYFILKKEYFTEVFLNEVKNDLTVKPFINSDYVSGDDDDSEFTLYKENNTELKVPKFYGMKKIGNIDKTQKLKFKNLKHLDFVFPRREQQVIATDSCLDVLRDTGGCLLCAGCGFGKTSCCLYIWSQLKVPLLIIVHKNFLLNQWKESIEKFVPSAKIGTIQGKTIDFEDKDVVIGMLQSVCRDKYPKEVFKNFGMVAVDEAHHISSRIFSKALPIISTKYMLGLTATPNRKDGLTKVFKWFLGDIAFKASSMNNFKVLTYQIIFKNGDIDYSKEITNFKGQPMIPMMINNICNCYYRNQLIINITKKLSVHEGRQILILSNRRNHLSYLKNEIDKLEYLTTGFYVGGGGSSKKKNLELKESETKKIIFGTFDMAREGLDIPTLNTIILASPISDAEQAIGRAMRKKTEINPVIIDIVDDFSIFKGMSYKRNKLYKKNNFVNMKKEIKMYNSFGKEGPSFREQLLNINLSNIKELIDMNDIKVYPEIEKMKQLKNETVDISNYFNKNNDLTSDEE
jgi:superfamily II DNA or RNA helicase